MADGPHTTLQLPQPWKEVLKRAENEAFTIGEVVEAACGALLRDFSREGVLALVTSSRKWMCQALPSEDATVLWLELQKDTVAGRPLAIMFLDCLIKSVKDGHRDDALEGSLRCALRDLLERRRRQIQQHLAIRSRPGFRSRELLRLQDAEDSLNRRKLARSILENGTNVRVSESSSGLGVDDGVYLP